MTVVAAPIASSAATRAVLRPTVSPMCPTSRPPTGLAMNPTANVAKHSNVPTKGAFDGKNAAGKTRAAAVP